MMTNPGTRTNPPQPVKTCLSWIGGKTYLAPWILHYLPPHRVYVEPFAGSAAVLLAKKPSPLEVINDRDEGLITWYRVLRDPQTVDEFIRRVELWPYSRREWYRARETWRTCEDPVEKALRWFVVAAQSFSGAWGRSWSLATGTTPTGEIREATKTWRNLPPKLAALHHRLQYVQVEDKDWSTMVTLYDAPRTLFYLDPPYITGTRTVAKLYAQEMTDADHQAMVETLLTMQSMVILSGYAHPLYAPLEAAGWHQVTRPSVLHSHARSRDHHGQGTGSMAHHFRQECLWINPPAWAVQRQMSLFDDEL